MLRATVFETSTKAALETSAAFGLYWRQGGTGFFDADQGGDPALLQHIYWFFGHPEIYNLIYPAVILILGFIIWRRSRSAPFNIKTLLRRIISVPGLWLLISPIGFITAIIGAHSAYTVGTTLHDTYYISMTFRWALIQMIMCLGLGLFFALFHKLFSRTYSRALALMQWAFGLGAALSFVALQRFGIFGVPRRYVAEGFDETIKTTEMWTGMALACAAASLITFALLMVKSLRSGKRPRALVPLPHGPDLFKPPLWKTGSGLWLLFALALAGQFYISRVIILSENSREFLSAAALFWIVISVVFAGLYALFSKVSRRGVSIIGVVFHITAFATAFFMQFQTFKFRMNLGTVSDNDFGGGWVMYPPMSTTENAGGLIDPLLYPMLTKIAVWIGLAIFTLTLVEARARKRPLPRKAFDSIESAFE